MYGGKDTLYEVLGVNRSASPGDIVRAYRTRRAQLVVGTTADDAAQTALVHEAYEVLSDPQKRAAYDASLRDKGFLRPERLSSKGPKYGLIAGAAVLVVGLIAWWRWSADGPEASIPQEIVASVATAVGRIERLDMQGKATPLGHAFAIDQGLMVTTCSPPVANTQLVVSFGGRRASAQMTQPDKSRNVCRLAVVAAGSWPLQISKEEPKVGSKVFAAVINSNGEAGIVEGKVKSLIPADGGARAIEFTIPVNPGMSGAPLLDVYGRVVGMMAFQHPFGPRQVALPAAWVAAQR
jgi:hypothetical protein